MTATIEERVARGAAWLTEVKPGWRDQIRLDKLTLSSFTNCPLGQVFGDPRTPGRTGYSIGLDAIHAAGLRGHDLGFVSVRAADTRPLGQTAGWVMEEVDALNAEWRRVIHTPRLVAA